MDEGKTVMAYVDDEGRFIDEDQVIDEFLGEKPRARDLRLMRAVLQERRERIRTDREKTAPESAENLKMTHQIKELTKQINALLQEEGITEFVENSVRLTLQAPSEDEFD